jgi:hypothetical protein
MSEVGVRVSWLLPWLLMICGAAMILKRFTKVFYWKRWILGIWIAGILLAGLTAPVNMKCQETILMAAPVRGQTFKTRSNAPEETMARSTSLRALTEDTHSERKS